MLLLWKVNWIPTSQLGITKKKTKTPKPLICGLTSGSDSCGLANHARVSPELRCGCCQPRPPCAGPEPTQTPWTRSLPRCSCPRALLALLPSTPQLQENPQKSSTAALGLCQHASGTPRGPDQASHFAICSLLTRLTGTAWRCSPLGSVSDQFN